MGPWFTSIVLIMSARLSRTIYVGNLPIDIRESEVEDLFYKYGHVVEIQLKNPPRPPGYCFVEFESSRDAEDAVRGRDGYNFDGHRLRVELAHGGRGQSVSVGRGGRHGSGGSKFGVSHRSEFRVIVKGLPSSASWQDLKDHMRKAGDVCFAQVFRDGDGAMGLVDYTNYEDMKYAIRKLDDTEFRNPFSRSYIRVKSYERTNQLNGLYHDQYPSLHLQDPDLCLQPECRDQGLDQSQADYARVLRRPMAASSIGELACTYAALILNDDDIAITSEKISTLVKAANVTIDSYWAPLFAKLLEKRSVDDLILSVGSGGGGAPIGVSAAPAAGDGGSVPAAAPAAEEKKEEPKEESDDDMGFSFVRVPMAAVMASRFISRTSCSSYGGAFDSEAMTFQSRRVPYLSTHATTYEGLRTRNVVDSRQMQLNAKATSRQARRGTRHASHRPWAIVVCGSGMNLVFVGAEVAPWSKTGGLGDVLGGLPPAMAANGHRVMTVAPRYDQYKDGWDTGVLVELKVGDRTETVRFFHCYKRGVDRVFVDHPMFLEKVWGKTGGKIYGPVTGTDFEDNQLRFSLLCQAALEAPRVLHFNNSKYHSGPYGEDVVFIANDWHTALLPCYLKTMYQSHGIYKNAKVAFCIHNIAYQGRFAYSDFARLNLPDKFKSSFDFIDGYDKPVKGRKINWMKAGIIESDRVLTVSPYYAQELVSGVEKGVELDNILRMTGITGIVNGMDTNEWNPSTDKYISANYDATTVMDAKPLNKEALQAEVGLPVDPNIPVIAFIGRLEEQKGSDILASAIPEFIDEDVQVVVLGTGKKKLERQLALLETMFPDKVRAHLKFNVPLAHGIMAGADILAVTSRFEPCGLIQLQAMQYGIPPMCSTTGGLVDTVKEGCTGFHMGPFSVECAVADKADVQKVVKTVKRALKVYGTPAFAEMIQNCMAQDLSWKGPAKKWEQFLLSLGAANSEPGIDGEEVAPLAVENVAAP
ncbi:unnamed protein product [Musa banksii]